MLDNAVTFQVECLTFVDINECSSNPCLNSAACSDVVNGYTCACLPGYTGINCETGDSQNVE